MKPYALFCRATATRIVASHCPESRPFVRSSRATSAAPISEEPSDSDPGSPNGGMENTPPAIGLAFATPLRTTGSSSAENGSVFTTASLTEAGRNVRGSFFDEEIKFTGELDFAKLYRVGTSRGPQRFGEVRWRDGLNPNLRVGAASNFQPSHFQSGKQWRLMTFGLDLHDPGTLRHQGISHATGGWLQPQKEFIDQPLSKLFVNNAFESSKGIGANIPFSSSFTTWGGTLKVKPVDWYYAKAGLFMSYPEATSTDNHGLAFEGFGPDPNQNGLFAIGETGFTPKIGASKLPGKYAAGAILLRGVEQLLLRNAAIRAATASTGRLDQMLFREPSPEEPAPLAKGPSDGKSIADGKSTEPFKEPVPPKKPKLSDQGLYFFSLFTYAPKYNNILPFYFHTGLVYKGLIPTRNEDQLMAAFSFGQYSFYNIESLQAERHMSISPTTHVFWKSTTACRSTSGLISSPTFSTSFSPTEPAPLRTPRSLAS